MLREVLTGGGAGRRPRSMCSRLRDDAAGRARGGEGRRVAAGMLWRPSGAGERLSARARSHVPGVALAMCMPCNGMIGRRGSSLIAVLFVERAGCWTRGEVGSTREVCLRGCDGARYVAWRSRRGGACDVRSRNGEVIKHTGERAARRTARVSRRRGTHTACVGLLSVGVGTRYVAHPGHTLQLHAHPPARPAPPLAHSVQCRNGEPRNRAGRAALRDNGQPVLSSNGERGTIYYIH